MCKRRVSNLGSLLGTYTKNSIVFSRRPIFRRFNRSSRYGLKLRSPVSFMRLSLTTQISALVSLRWCRKELVTMSSRSISWATSAAKERAIISSGLTGTRVSKKTLCWHSSSTLNTKFWKGPKNKNAKISYHLSLWCSLTRPHSLFSRGTRWISDGTSKSTERPESWRTYCFRSSLDWESCTVWG